MDNDLYVCEMRNQEDRKRGTLTDVELNVRSLRRKLWAARNNSASNLIAGITDTLRSTYALNDGLHLDEAAFATNRNAFESALATLVADGASPTQAHVTAANTAYSTYKTADLPVRHHVAADRSTFESALATLVADGASPTQAHVTSANNAYTTFKAGVI